MDEYEDYDATGLAELVARGDVTPHELLEEALARVEKYNPRLNAVVLRRETVAKQHIENGLPDGRFRGVPFLLKDLGAEAIDFPSNNGSRLFADTTYSYDSEIYLRIKRSGFVTFARTTAPELGVGPVTEAQVYNGPSRNPWNLDHTPGGSSGGAAAAVAAGIVPAAHGSDGGGSVRIPASCCGLVGFKPTRARLPDGPAVGEGWAGMAIDGFLTRSVRDTAGLLDATQGPDLGDPYCAPPLRGTFAHAIATPPSKLRVAYSICSFDGVPVHPECREAVEKGARLVEGMGHDVREVDLNVDIAPMMSAWTKIVACGVALSVRNKVCDGGLEEQSIEGVTRGAVKLAQSVSGADYLEAVNTIHTFGRKMAAAFLEFDVLMTPTLAEPPARIGRFKPDNEDFIDYRMGPNGVFDYSPFTAAFNATGQPAISIPIHWSADNLPIGLHLAAAFGDDERLLSLAAQFEAAEQWHRRRCAPPA